MTVITEVTPPVEVKLWDVSETVSVGASCVTFIVLVIPPPETVTVALRSVDAVFAVAVRVTEPLLLPLVGETVSHAMLFDTVQLWLDVTLIVIEPPS